MSASHASQVSLEEKRRAVMELRLRQRRLAEAARDRMERLPRNGGPLPTLLQQDGLWYLDRLAPGLPVYNVPYALRLTGPLKREALTEALRRLVHRHESLRSRFADDDGIPRLVVAPPPVEWALPVTDLTSLPLPERDARVRELVDAESSNGFDLANGPLFRTLLLSLGAEEHVLILGMHHIVTDGWSVGVLSRELGELYGGRELPELPLQPADFAAWQRERLSGESLAPRLAQFKERLAGLPAVDLPTDRPRPAVPSWAGATFAREVPAVTADRVRAHAVEQEVSPLAVLLAGFSVVLRRHTGQEDLTVGSVFSGRTRSEIEPLVGFFANTLPLRASLAGNPTGRQLVARWNEAVRGGVVDQDVPFGLVVDALKPERDPSRHPLFQICFSLLPPGSEGGRFSFDGVDAEPLPLNLTSSRFDLTVNVEDSGAGPMRLHTEYATDLFDRDRVERMLDQLTDAVTLLTKKPDTALDELPPVGAYDPDGADPQSAAEARPPAVPAADASVASVARTHPRRIAVRHGSRTVDYATLDRSADRVVRLLATHGVRHRARVGILASPSIALVTALVGTARAGAGYLLLDPDQPVARIRHLLARAEANVVLAEPSAAERFADALAGTTIVTLDENPDQDAPPADGEKDSVSDSSDASDLAHIATTGGITGSPRSRPVTRGEVAARLARLQAVHPLGPDDTVLRVGPLTTDLTVTALLWPLSAGAGIVFTNPGAPAEAATVVHGTPSTLAAWLDATTPADGTASTRLVLVGGEAFPTRLADRLRSAWPQADIASLYAVSDADGEIATWTSIPHGSGITIPLGRPFPGVACEVLDSAGHLVPLGVTGELHAGGQATGDLVRWRVDGVLEFICRTADRAEHAGLHLRFDAIEQALLGHPAVRAAVATAYVPAAELDIAEGDDSGTGRDRPVAYVVLGDTHTDVGGDTSVVLADLRDRLAAELSAPLIPESITVLDALPLSEDGRVVRRRLPIPQSAREKELTPPATPTEREIAVLWQSMFDVPREAIGVETGFFELGGNSLAATRLVSRIRDTFHIDLELREFFAAPELGRLAACVDRAVERTLSDDPGLTDLEALAAGLSEEEIDRLLAADPNGKG